MVYTLLIKDNSNVKAKVIASISKVLCSAENSEEVIEVLVSPKDKNSFTYCNREGLWS